MVPPPFPPATKATVLFSSKYPRDEETDPFLGKPSTPSLHPHLVLRVTIPPPTRYKGNCVIHGQVIRVYFRKITFLGRPSLTFTHPYPPYQGNYSISGYTTSTTPLHPPCQTVQFLGKGAKNSLICNVFRWGTSKSNPFKDIL